MKNFKKNLIYYQINLFFENINKKFGNCLIKNINYNKI